MPKLHAVRMGLLLVLAGFVAMAALPSAARAVDGDTLVAEIPFDFYVAGKTFPAGTYRVELGPGPTDPQILAIQTASSDMDELTFRKVFASTTPIKPAEGQSRLVFKRVGDLHFLEKVVPASGPVEEVR